MGIKWMLVNRKTRTMFEMGKGGSEICDICASGAPLDEAALRDLIADWCRNWKFDPKDPADTPQAYAAWLAPRLIRFVGDATASDLDVVNDCNDGEDAYRAMGYVVIDARYSAPEYHPAPCPTCGSAERGHTVRGAKETVKHRFDCPDARTKWDRYGWWWTPEDLAAYRQEFEAREAARAKQPKSPPEPRP